MRSLYTEDNGEHVFISDMAIPMMSGHILSVDHCPLCEGHTSELLNFTSQEAHDADGHNPIRFGPISPKCVYCATGRLSLTH